jgi:hypothetical protein
VVPLAQQAVDRARARALHAGIPVRLQSERRKVLATTDRRALAEALDRLLALALTTASAAGVRLDVSPQRGQPQLTATWELARGTALPETEDPLLALDLALCKSLAARAGGALSLGVELHEVTVVLALDGAVRG